MSKNTAAGGKVRVSETSGAEEEKDISEIMNLRIEEKTCYEFFNLVLFLKIVCYLKGGRRMTRTLNMRCSPVRMVRPNNQNHNTR